MYPNLMTQYKQFSLPLNNITNLNNSGLLCMSSNICSKNKFLLSRNINKQSKKIGNFVI